MRENLRSYRLFATELAEHACNIQIKLSDFLGIPIFD